ncbi:Uncharacterised protein [Mycobacteroides abscessus subsp. massiliense]|nr:Uncharacterised protein [Mycobacteroides abscessus subsp. massiliense]
MLGAVLIAEEQPIGARVAECPAFLQESAERGNTSSRADHDHRRVGRAGRPEMRRTLQKDRDRQVLGTIGQEGRSHTTAR